MVHEAFPARRPFQKVIHPSLDVGAGESWVNPSAVNRHPHRHPGMRQVGVQVNRGGFHTGATISLHCAVARSRS